MKKELGITVSVGVSFNKIFAKLGSDYKKPDAITTMYEDEFQRKAWCLPAQCKIPCTKILICHFLIIFFFIIPIKAAPRTGYSFRCGALCFAGNIFALQGMGSRLQGQVSAIREGNFCGQITGHGDGVGHFGCSQGNGRLDTLCLSGMCNICAGCALF